MGASSVHVLKCEVFLKVSRSIDENISTLAGILLGFGYEPTTYSG